MARKWHPFHRTVESFFLKLIPSRIGVFRRRAYRLLVLLVLGIFLSVGISPVFSQIPVNQSQNVAEELVEQGKNYYQNGQVSEAINSLQQAREIFKIQNDWVNLAITSTNLSRIFQELGQYSRACSTLEQVIEPDLKFCQDRESTEENSEEVSEKSPELPARIQVSVWRSFGDVLRAIGKLKESEIVLEKALNLADEPNALAATRLSLGNTYRAWGDLERDRLAEPKYEYIPWRCEVMNLPEEALKYYEKADKKYKSIFNNDESIQEKLWIKSQLNRLSLLLIQKKWQEANNLFAQIKFDALPPGQSKVYARINYAKSLACLKQKYPQASHSWADITHQIHEAIEDAKNLEVKRDLEDRHTSSYVIGNLGGLYEYLSEIETKPEVPEFKELCQKEQEFSNKAQCLTQEALYRAQPEKAPDIAYQWQWQLGRLFEARGQREEAIANYEAAIKTLESVRDDLLSINSDVQFNFRDNVEPLYRELVALLLPVGEKNPSQENLKKAVYYIDSLQLAELENFLRCNLQGDIETVQIQQISKPNERIEELFTGIDQILDNYPTKAAFLYPILLKGQISVILKLPGKDKLEYLQTQVAKDSVRQTVDNALESMDCRNLNCNKLNENASIIQEQKNTLNKLYQWLIGKLENNLKQEKIKTLIFVSDNEFRRIPMSALFDGEHFVVEKEYATTISSGVQLLKSQASTTNQLKALIVGAIKKRPNLYDIKNEVKEQTYSIRKNLENYQILSEGQFTKENLQREIKKAFYTIIHIIAHGQFSSDPKETYIFTDDESKEINDLKKYYLKINEFSELLQKRDQFKPIDLLFLSSCQTSKGDKRAVLGIAGITIKSGAIGTIAPLWNAETISTRQLVEKFYENLANQDQVNKAEALRLAQNSLRKEYDYSPHDWAGFVLVGN